MAGSVFVFGNIQSFLQQMFQMLIKLPRLQRRPCQLLEMLSPLQSPQQPFHMGITDHVLTGESQVLGTDIRSERQLFQSPWLASFSLLSQCPFSYTEPTDHTFQTRMCWPHPETKGHTGLIHRVERLPCSKPCNNAFWSEKDGNGGDRREGKETTYQQEPRWTELNTGSLAFRKGKFVAAFPAMGLRGQTLFSQQRRPLSAFLAAGTACPKAQSSKRTLHFRGLASSLACWELRVVERNEARKGLVKFS